MPSPLQISLKVTGLDQAKADLQQFAQGGKRSFEELAAEAKKLSDTSATTDQALRGVANRVRQMSADLDPAAAASIRLRNALTDVERALAANFIGATQAATISAALRREHDDLSRSSAAVTAATNDLSGAHTRLSTQGMEAFHVMRSMTEQMVIGTPPTMVLTQHLSQLSYAASGPGGLKSAFGEAITTLRGFISPTSLAIAGVAGLTAGVVLLALRSNTSTESVRQFNVVLQGMGVQSLASAQGLEAAAKNLLDVGVNAAEARKQIIDVARAGLNPAVAPQIVRTGANLTSYLGGDQTQALTQALAGGVDAAAKYAVQVGALTGAQAALRQEMARTAPGAKVLDDILQQITKHAEGLYQQGLSPVGKALNETKVAVDRLFESMSKSGEVQGFIKGIKDTISELDHIVQVIDKVKNFISGAAGPRVVAEAAIPTDNGAALSQLGATPAEIAILAQIRQRESSGVYNTFHATGATVSSLDDVRSFSGASHAFGAYGFQPGTYESMASRTGYSDISPGSQDANALALLRQYGPNSTASWAASMPPGGYPTAGIARGGVGVAGAGTAVSEEAIRQAREYADAQNRAAQATQGLGLENEKAKIAAEVAGRTELTASEQAKLASDLFAASKIRLTNEIKNAADQTANEITGVRNVSEAYLQGSKAGLAMEAAVKAGTEAFAKFGTVSSAESQQFAADRFKELTALEKQNEALQNSKDLLSQKNNQDVLKLEISLQGQNTEQITRQVTLLQAKQQIDQQFPLLTQQEKDNRLAMVQATADQVVKLAEVTRAQQRIDDLFRSIGDTISSTIGTAITNIFDGKKITDWGAQLKSIMSSVVSQVAQSLLIKPLIGSVLGGLGASANVTNQFGTLGGTSSGGGISTSTLLQGGGLLKDVFGLGGGSSSSSSGGLFGNLFSPFSSGGLFGSQGALFGTAADISIAGGGPPLALGAGGEGLFSALGGSSGLGLSGGLLSSLGGLVPILGLLGGAGFLLSGLFGNKKPSNASAGANFDLSNFSLTAGFAGGNSQIDQSTKQVADGVQQFLAMLKTTGGALSGNVLLQNGVNTGFTVDSSLPQYSGRFNLGKDPTQALNIIELALSRSLTGISDTMQQVINQISDPAAVQGAIAFATAYDNLKTAADDAFKSVEDAAKTTSGPFRQAMDQINAVFGSLTDQANQFGLSLDPINASLAEATKRLQGDFTDALNKAFNEATGAGFLNQVQGVYDNYIASITESQAIGLGADRPTQDLLGQVATAQINQVLSGLSTAQLDQVIQHFTGLNDTIVTLAQSAETAAGATTDLATAQESMTRTTAAVTQISDYLTSLKSTPSAVTSPLDALNFASSNYQTLLSRARGGDLTSLEGLTGAAGSLVQNISSFYGATAPGAAQVSKIEQELAAVAATYGGANDPTIAAITGSTSAIQVAAASNDNWLSSIFDVTAAFGDTTRDQLDQLLSISREIRDQLRLQAAA